MNNHACSVRIEIHLVDGTSRSFSNDDPQANERIVERFVPHKVFAEPFVAVEGLNGISIFPSSSITRMDLKLTPDPLWRTRGSVAETKIREVTRADFEAAIFENSSELVRRERAPGEDFRGFVVFHMCDASEIIMEIQTKVANIPDQKMVLENMRGITTLFFANANGGYVFVNMANLLWMDVLPGQPNIAPQAWRAEPGKTADAKPMEVSSHGGLSTPCCPDVM